MIGVMTFKVSVARREDGSTQLEILLDGDDWTFETYTLPDVAFRLGQELIRASKEIGLPVGMVDTAIP